MPTTPLSMAHHNIKPLPLLVLLYCSCGGQLIVLPSTSTRKPYNSCAPILPTSCAFCHSYNANTLPETHTMTFCQRPHMWHSIHDCTVGRRDTFWHASTEEEKIGEQLQ